MSEPRFEQPGRGNGEAYARYLEGMDASMKQKVALTAAHLLCQGRVADMGMGSGSGSHALAALYPTLEVVGVDIDGEMVERARAVHQLPNLSFVVGDIARPIFETGTLDGVFDSSVLHHVTSYGGYVLKNAADALEAQARELREHGILVVRDFVDPGQQTVLLDLPTDDGDTSRDPRTCSTAALFERFAGEFRSLHPSPGFEYENASATHVALKAAHRRYQMPLKMAAEFVLRKDYRSDWESEVREEYTYFTQVEFESLFARLGLRVLASTPIWNPWIVRNRFVDKFKLWTPDGTPLEPPPTNYVIVGERVPEEEGVAFRDGGPGEPLGFLQMGHYRHKRSGQVRDLVRRPNLTVDVLPYFEFHGDIFVLARMSYPRPILRTDLDSPSLDGARAAAYVTEPLTVLQGDKPVGQTVEDALLTDGRITADRIRGFRAGATYYPSPGGIQEEVRSVLVEIEPLFVEERIINRSGFSTSGRVRAIEATQLLRAAQVGGLPDARVELNVHELLRQLGRPLGPWISEALKISERPPPRLVSNMKQLRDRTPRRLFESVEPSQSHRFLRLNTRRFEELDARGRLLNRKSLECVIPENLSVNTVATCLLRRRDDIIYLGVDDDDLPAAQCFNGNSHLLTTPAWRLPRSIANLTAARQWVGQRVASEHGIEVGEIWDLGGRYFPSAGVTPEVVYPMAIEVLAESDAPRPLRWISLADAVENRAELVDGHLRIVALRAAHALGDFGAKR